MRKIRCKIERNRCIKDIAIQKQLYSILIGKIHNGWNPLVSKRLGDYGIESALINDSFEFFKLKLKRIQPHLRMTFVKTLTNGWHTSSRMHEAVCLPCIFGCNSLPNNLICSFDNNSCKPIRDETAHYLNCPILIGIISQAASLEHLPDLHELIFGKDRNDLTGALTCSTSYHVYHSLKLGKLSLIQHAIESGMFSQVRAYAYSSAKAFLSDFDIQSNGVTLNCGSNSGLSRDTATGYQAGTLVDSPVPTALDLTSSSDPAAFNEHFYN